MLTLYSYPPLFGVADNNGYGLKVFAFLRLAGVPFRHEHIFDASKAPRGQLPYIVDGHDSVGDSETILVYVTEKYGVTLDLALTPEQRATNLLITRTLDDLYWVMSYSRWKDGRYWPQFRDALKREHPGVTDDVAELEAMRAFLGTVKVDMIQTRTLNIDPEWYFATVGRPAEAAGMREAIAEMRGAGVRVGNFTHTH